MAPRTIGDGARPLLSDLRSVDDLLCILPVQLGCQRHPSGVHGRLPCWCCLDGNALSLSSRQHFESTMKCKERAIIATALGCAKYCLRPLYQYLSCLSGRPTKSYAVTSGLSLSRLCDVKEKDF